MSRHETHPRYEGQGSQNKHTTPKTVPKQQPAAKVNITAASSVAAHSSATLVDLALGDVSPGVQAFVIEDVVEETCALPPGRGRAGTGGVLRPKHPSAHAQTKHKLHSGPRDRAPARFARGS